MCLSLRGRGSAVCCRTCRQAGGRAGRESAELCVSVDLELKTHKQRLMHTRLIQNTHCPYSKPLTASPITNHCNPQPASGATLNMQTNYPSSSAFCRRRHLSAAEKLAQPHGRLWSPDVVFVCRASCCSLQRSGGYASSLDVAAMSLSCICSFLVKPDKQKSYFCLLLFFLILQNCVKWMEPCKWRCVTALGVALELPLKC